MSDLSHEPDPKISLSDVYAAVAARRTQWDNLVWQVPVLTFTAQAFLLTLALGPDTSLTGRILAAVASAGITLLCITLMKRHRQAELKDAHWLADREQQLGETMIVHGEKFRDDRNITDVHAGRIGKLVPTWPGYKAWTLGLSAFFVVDALVIVLAFSSALTVEVPNAVTPAPALTSSPAATP